MIFDFFKCRDYKLSWLKILFPPKSQVLGYFIARLQYTFSKGANIRKFSQLENPLLYYTKPFVNV